MSYWNDHERTPGIFDFSQLDWQIATIKQAGGIVSLSLGARQPRWPENHWPGWAWDLPKPERGAALLRYIETVIERYKHEPILVSYQLENEALITNFGERSEVDRKRLKAEYQLVMTLDPSRPIIMTTSTSWGIPLRAPIPDEIGFSFYHTLYRKGAYHHSNFSPAVHRVRKALIYLLHNCPVFIHELQLEPWGPAAIWKMPISEQDKSMSVAHIKENMRLAQQIKAPPLDLWGGEWWYWRWQQGDPTIWRAVRQAIAPQLAEPTE